MGFTKVKLVRFVMAIIFFYIFGFFTLMLAFFSIKFFFRGGERVRDGYVNPFKYQTLRVKSSNNEYSFGMTYIPRELGKEEFISTQDEESSDLSLISHFGSDEYVCTGTCSCENSISGRRYASVIPRTLMYLVAASSSLLAIQFAKHRFEEECEEGFGDICPLDYTHIEVDECKSAYTASDSESSSSSTEEEEEESNKNDPNRTQKFLCSGTCRPTDPSKVLFFAEDWEKNFSWKIDPRLKEIMMGVEEFEIWEHKCPKIKMEKEVEVKVVTGEFEEDFDTKLSAKEYFYTNHLNDYCVRESIIPDEDLRALGRPPLDLVFNDVKGRGLAYCTGDAYLPLMRLTPEIDVMEIYGERENIDCRRIKDK